MKIYEKFGNDEEALSMLRVGELSVLSVKAVTDKEVRAVIAMKKEYPALGRGGIEALLTQR